MATKNSEILVPRQMRLRCNHCGNSDRFREIMAYESHIVNGNLDYVRLDEAITEEYQCCACGKVVEPR